MNVFYPNPCNPCNPCGTVPEVTECPECPDMTGCWELVVAGVTDGPNCSGPLSCSHLNGVFILKYTEVSCVFRPDDKLSICLVTEDYPWSLNIGGSKVQLSTSVPIFPGSLTKVFYEIDTVDFDCSGPSILDIVNPGNPATAICLFPSTLTIEPIACP